MGIDIGWNEKVKQSFDYQITVDKDYRLCDSENVRSMSTATGYVLLIYCLVSPVSQFCSTSID